MNNKGQSLVLFVLILPILTLILALVLDSLLAYSNKMRLEGAIESNLEIVLKENIRDTEKIKNVILGNIDGESDCKIEVSDNNLKILINLEKNSLFGHILDFDFYNLEANYCGNYNNYQISKGGEC